MPIIEIDTSTPAKMRLFAVSGMLSFAYLTWANWRMLMTEGQYYANRSVYAPMCVLMCLVILVRPDWAGPPRTRQDWVRQTILVVLCLVPGIVNSSLMGSWHP